MTTLVRQEVVESVARITLNRPGRHNSLIPELIDELNAALNEAAALPRLIALVLQAEGRSFSTGGDVAGFHAVERGQRADYAEKLVGGLNKAILALLDLPIPVIVRVQGPVTGGSLGFLLAADLVAFHESAFIQPYYSEVGFSPDGGWTALLPERIGAHRAAEIQLLNRRIEASEALQLGLADAVFNGNALDDGVAAWIDQLRGKQPAALTATKKRLLPPGRRSAIEAGLGTELQSFVALIDTEATEQGMLRFLGSAGKK